MWRPGTIKKPGRNRKAKRVGIKYSQFFKCGVSTIITDEIFMKKVLIAFIVFFGFSVLSMAQPVTKPVKKAADKTKVAPAAKAATPAKTATMPKTATKAPATEKVKTTAKAPAADKQNPSAAAPGVLKKDGTPDKRYKANKTATGPLKKDGTPDMRYKSNKPTK